MPSKIKQLVDTWRDARRLRRILAEVPQRQSTRKRVVFHTAKQDFLFLIKEGFLAHTLARLGARVHMILDDGISPHWEHGKYDYRRQGLGEGNPLRQSSILKRAFVKLRLKLILSSLAHQNLQINTYSQLLAKDLPEEAVASGIDHSKYALESTVRYFRSSDLDFSNPDTIAYQQQSEENSRISLKIARAIYHLIQPDVYVCSHGFYSLWGAAYRYLQSRGIRGIVWNGHSTAGHIRLIADSYLMPLNDTREWQEFSRQSLTPEMQAWTEAYFQQRFAFNTRDTKIYYEIVDDTVELDLENYNGKVFCAFPNVSWDACITEKNIGFNGLLDWLKETALYFLQHQDQQLIIRFHPSEATMLKGSVKLQKILEQHLPQITAAKNIHLIDSERRIDTYQLIRKYVDIGLVYDGTLALELPYLKVPVIQAGRGVFNCEGIQTAAETRKKYLEMLQQPEKVIADFNDNYSHIYQHLMKYAYWFYRDSGYFHPLRTGVVEQAEVTATNFEDHPAFRRTLEKILGEPIA